MSWPEYAQTKDSDIQWLERIPTSWTSRRLGSLYFEIDERRGDQDGLELLSVSIHRGVQLRSDLITDKEARADDLAGYKVCRAGDIILNRMRAFQGGLGASPRDGIVSPDYMVIRPTGDVDSPFLAYLMKTNWFVQQMSSLLRGIGSTDQGNARTPRINPTDLGNIKVPLPPPDVQAKIVGFVDHETHKIDALIGKQDQLIAALRENRTATITQAVTTGLDANAGMRDSGAEWLPAIPSSWVATPLKRVCAVRDCKHLTAEFVDDGYSLASIREVQSRYVDLTNAKRTTETYFKQLREGGRGPQDGDLIFSRNATVGEVAQVAQQPEPFAMGQDVCLLRPAIGKLDPDYTWYVLRSQLVSTQIELMMIGSTFKRINVEEIKSLVITCPSVREQRDIVEFLDDRCGRIEALIAKAQDVVDTLREFRSALITDAVTGKIDVRGAA